MRDWIAVPIVTSCITLAILVVIVFMGVSMTARVDKHPERRFNLLNVGSAVAA